MNNFKSYVDSVLQIWNEAAPAARVGILLLATLCFSALLAIGYWSSQPSYITLISEADHDQVDRVIDALDKANIPYDLSGAGGNLRVSKSDFSKARMLARGAGAEPVDSMDLGITNAFGSPADRQRMAILKQQKRLADTIAKLNVVSQADVHLNVPDKGPFERNTSKPTAAVMLELVPGSSLSEHQANSIASMVAYAVEDLQPEAVQITDKDGRSYTMAEEGMQYIASQVEYTTATERKLARKAETQLFHFLGHGNASVQVSLDLTFTNGSKTTTRYDADGKVPTTEDLNTEVSSTSDSVARGGAGTAANLTNRDSNGTSENKTESIRTSYLVPKTEETQSNTTPQKNFMTVSVLVNAQAESIVDDNGSLIEGIQQQVQSIVENAVGFRNGTDTISVEFLRFPDLGTSEEPVVPYNWHQWNEIIRNASLAIAALVAFLIGFLALRKIKPAPPVTESVQLDKSRSQSIDQLSELVKTNPEVFAQIIESWAGNVDQENDEEPDTVPFQNKRAA